jgi:aminomethyltransferase
MPDTPAAVLKKTPLHARHLALGARMVPFGGWDMPVEYSGIADEHLAVRTRAGLFDVSHMGEIEIAGDDALDAVQHLSSNDASKLKIGQIHYAGLLTPRGTFVDDMLVYRLADRHFMLVVNAANIPRDVAWVRERLGAFNRDAVAVDTSSRYALIAIQGPAARTILARVTAVDLDALRYYWFTTGEVAGVLATVSRTGYTGEDGFEVFVPPAAADKVWNALHEAGRPDGLLPAGLGARDTLRLEAAMRLYGNDIDDTTTALEADLAWIVGWNKADLPGADVLRRQRAEGITRKLVGLEILDRGIARHGHDVYVSGEKAGVVTSGTQTPFLKKAIAMAYVPTAAAVPGHEVEVDVRGRRLRAVVVPLPFYKRPRS